MPVICFLYNLRNSRCFYGAYHNCILSRCTGTGFIRSAAVKHTGVSVRLSLFMRGNSNFCPGYFPIHVQRTVSGGGQKAGIYGLASCGICHPQDNPYGLGAPKSGKLGHIFPGSYQSPHQQAVYCHFGAEDKITPSRLREGGYTDCRKKMCGSSIFLKPCKSM